MVEIGEEIKTLSIKFERPNSKLMLILNGIIKTEIVITRPFATPLLIVTYKGLKQEFFNFLSINMAQQLKNAIDEKKDFVFLEGI